MKRKISLLLCILMVSLCFVGCSEKKQGIDVEDKQMMEMSADWIISLLTAEENKELLDSIKEFSEFQLQYYMIQVPIAAEEMPSMIEAWETATQECGEYVTNDEYVYETKNDGYVVTTNVEFEDRNATVQFTYDEDCKLESLDVSAKYQMNEILTKAGLNTVLGMGTVFAVLIFLAFLISLMKYIPNLLELLKDSGKEDVFDDIDDAGAEDEDIELENVAVADVSQASDDLELVAVITAAIAAQRGTSSDGFVVRSIRRRPSNLW